MARIIDGRRIAGEVRNEWRSRAETLRSLGVTPCLSAIIVGEDPASKLYVRNKLRACAEIGIASR
jgi:methylenetetrahydrofolate dehydrogenase (NADP+)/methenyltetrahydrofolate cyclohydrolase